MIAAKGKHKMCLLQRGKMRNTVKCIVPGTENQLFGGKKNCTTVRIYGKFTLGYPTTFKTQTRATAGTQEITTWGKHNTQSELQPTPFLTYWKNTKSSIAVVKEKHKLRLFLRKRKTEIAVVQNATR